MCSVSIVTAAYRGELLPRVWDSIKNQTFPRWEWVLVNDNQNSVREWYTSFITSEGKELHEQGRVWMIDLHKQLGRFGLFGRNIGVMAASFEYIAFHDDDNLWTPDHLQSLADAQAVAGKIPYSWMHIIGKKPGSIFEKIKRTGFSRQGIDLGCILWRKSLFEKYGYFPNTRQITFDFELMERVYKGEGAENFVCTNRDSLIFYHKRY